MTPPRPTPPEFYANAMAAQGGLYDVTLDFGRRIGGTDDLAWGVRVIMAWEHLRSTIAALQKVLDQYEHEIGTTRDIDEAVRESEEASP